MKQSLAYLKYVLRHKWFVLLACLDWRVSLWRGMVHDASKFSPSEFAQYARRFFNDDGSRRNVRDKSGAYNVAAIEGEFQYAWLHHQRNNLHHWQAWVIIGDNGELRPLPIPETYVREMIADWQGAGMAISGKNDLLSWYGTNRGKMILANETVEMIDRLLAARPAPKEESK